MSQASSSSSRRRGASEARVRRYTAPLVLEPPPQPEPLAVVPGPVFDEETGLPLVICPYCKDIRVIALTTKNSLKNLGKRFFKCPRNYQFDPTSCPMYKFKENYEEWLRRNGYLGSPNVLNVVPELLEELQDLKLVLGEVKEQVVVMKNRAPRINWCRAVFTIINMCIVLLLVIFVAVRK